MEEKIVVNEDDVVKAEEVSTTYGVGVDCVEVKESCDCQNLEKKIETLFKAVKEHDSRLTEVECIKNPQYLQGKVNILEEMLSDLQIKCNEIIASVKNFRMAEKFIEIFDPGEIKKLYDASGKSFNEVREFLQKEVWKAEVSDATVSRVLNDKQGDLIQRCAVGRWLRTSCMERDRKAKYDK